MPPAPCTTGSTITAASSPEWRSTSSRTPAAPRLVETVAEAVRRAFGEDVLGEHAREHAVHPADRVAHGHRAERVAVVAAADRKQARALAPTARALELQAQLDRDLDRDRAGVGEEDRVEAVRGELQQPLGQTHARLVRQPAE